MRVVIDTYGCFDPAVALWWAIQHLDVAAITTVAGNVTVDAATRVVLALLAAADRLDIPVGRGADRPARAVTRHAMTVDPPEAPVHDAVALLGTATDLVCLGPLSNVADAVERGATWTRVVAMGGPVERGEFNITHDAAATDVVRVALSPVFVGLDVTEQALFTEDEVALAEEGRTPAARFLAGPLRATVGHPCHDLVAVLTYAGSGLGGFHAAVHDLFS